MIMDQVKCCNCGWSGTVGVGDERCIGCNTTGHLSWIEDRPQEIEVKCVYYSAYDLDCKKYFHVGRNSIDRDSCVNSILDWVFDGDDCDNEDRHLGPADKYPDGEKEDLLSLYNIAIHAHQEPMDED